jgi:hypothetical protein
MRANRPGFYKYAFAYRHITCRPHISPDIPSLAEVMLWSVVYPISGVKLWGGVNVIFGMLVC